MYGKGRSRMNKYEKRMYLLGYTIKELAYETIVNEEVIQDLFNDISIDELDLKFVEDTLGFYSQVPESLFIQGDKEYNRKLIQIYSCTDDLIFLSKI